MSTGMNLHLGESGFPRALKALTQRLRRSLVAVRDGGPGGGSGVIWSADGVIVTNHHVAPGKRAQVILADGRTLEATVRVSDARRDLAVLDVAASGLPAAEIGNSDALRVGELVFAVGNPLGLIGAVSAGIVSGLGGRFGRGRRQGEGLIQADVSLAPGNSGGALATAEGRVVGINAMIHMPGLALAVPSNAVSALLNNGSLGHAYLGVTLVPAQLPPAWASEAAGEIGFLVTSVASGSPAEQSGLFVGDLLVAWDGTPLASEEQLAGALAELVPGDSLRLSVIRGGRALALELVTGRRLEKAA